MVICILRLANGGRLELGWQDSPKESPDPQNLPRNCCDDRTFSKRIGGTNETPV